MVGFGSQTDSMLREVFIYVAIAALVLYSMVFEVEYSPKLIELYMQPWWRVLVVLLLISGAIWCPRLGVLIALIAFFYLADMRTLLTPFASTEKAIA